jgi:hypothetical protein
MLSHSSNDAMKFRLILTKVAEGSGEMALKTRLICSTSWTTLVKTFLEFRHQPPLLPEHLLRGT